MLLRGEKHNGKSEMTGQFGKLESLMALITAVLLEWMDLKAQL